MTIRILILSFILVFAQPAPSAPPASGGRGGSAGQGDAATKKSDDAAGKRSKKPPRGLAFKALRMNIENARFDGMTFEEFAEWIERTTQANVVVKWNVLEEVGVSRDAVIHLKLKNVSIRKLLQLAFSEVTRDTDGVELAVKADDNTLTISTKRDLHSELVTRLYDVQSLLIIVPNFAGQGVGDPTTGRSAGGGRRVGGGIAAGGGGGGSGRGGGGGRSGGRGGESKSDTTEQLADRLIQMIVSNIEPDSWAVNGGKGTIAFYKGQLVVRNNLDVHERLGGATPQQARSQKRDEASQ